MFRTLLLSSLAALTWSCSKTPVAAAAVDAGTAALTIAAEVDAGPVVRFVAVGDTGKGNAGQRLVGASIGALCAASGCDFVVLLGDNFYPNGVGSTTDPQWKTAFIDPYAPVERALLRRAGQPRLRRRRRRHRPAPRRQPGRLLRGQPQVAHARPPLPVAARQTSEFFVADTNRSMFNVDEAVRTDFDTWLPASSAKWKIVFAHHPYKSNGEHGNAGTYDGLPFVPIANGAGVKTFHEERVCGRADVLMTGHDHSIQWLRGDLRTDGLDAADPAHRLGRRRGGHHAPRQATHPLPERQARLRLRGHPRQHPHRLVLRRQRRAEVHPHHPPNEHRDARHPVPLRARRRVHRAHLRVRRSRRHEGVVAEARRRRARGDQDARVRRRDEEPRCWC